MTRSTARWRTLALASLLALIAAPWGTARADIYRCTTADGRTLYADAPCPRGAVHGANITSAVGACTDEACALQREEAASQARARLRVEQDQLAQFADRRRRDEIAAENERARLEALKWRQSTDARLAVSADPGYAATYAPYYPIWPVYPMVRACGWRCVGLHPGVGKGVPIRRTWGTAIRLDRH
jgi:hypothetical protein